MKLYYNENRKTIINLTIIVGIMEEI